MIDRSRTIITEPVRGAAGKTLSEAWGQVSMATQFNAPLRYKRCEAALKRTRKKV
jgi:hypothetical protein